MSVRSLARSFILQETLMTVLMAMTALCQTSESASLSFLHLVRTGLSYAQSLVHNSMNTDIDEVSQYASQNKPWTLLASNNAAHVRPWPVQTNLQPMSY